MTSTALAPPLLADTLPAALLDHAAFRPHEPAFTFLKDGEEVESAFTWAELAQAAMRIAGELAARGLAGERALLVLPQGRDFICAFFGCLLARVVAVPLVPPTTHRLVERTRGILADCQARAVIANRTTAGTAGELAAGQALQTVLVEECARDGLIEPPEAADPAFLQYTSGSTGAPRGVVITHGNLRADSEFIHTAFGMRQDDVVVSWLPVFHDMGLIGMVVQASFLAQHSVHMTPQAMIRKPLRWLRAMSQWKATVTGAPDFAWRLLADRLTPADVAGLDLSPLKVAYSGSEAVRPSTLTRVSELLAPTGFQEEAWFPCYGLAETTLMVSGGPRGSGWQTALCRSGLPGSPAYVSCGAVVPEDAVAIVDPERCARRQEGEIGEVWVQGPHVAAGYWGRPEATEAAFRARLPGDGRNWLRTGDLGFLSDGQLHITGRIKDVLIVNGRKHHPEDVERTIQDRVPGCGAGACAVFQTPDGEGQRLVAAVELGDRPRDPAALAELLAQVATAVWSNHEITVDEVLPLRVGLIPRTTSGKVRRSETRRLHLEDHFSGARAGRE